MIVMDRPPFLSKNDPSPENEDDTWPSQPPPQQPVFIQQQRPAPDIFEQLKMNPMALVVIGIIIGAFLVNMRPVVIKP
jgi:hypothetical protein